MRRETLHFCDGRYYTSVTLLGIRFGTLALPLAADSHLESSPIGGTARNPVIYSSPEARRLISNSISIVLRWLENTPFDLSSADITANDLLMMSDADWFDISMASHDATCEATTDGGFCAVWIRNTGHNISNNEASLRIARDKLWDEGITCYQDIVAAKWAEMCEMNAALTHPSIDFDIFDVSNEDAYNSMTRRLIAGGSHFFGREYEHPTEEIDWWLDDAPSHGTWDVSDEGRLDELEQACRDGDCDGECHY